MGTRRQITWLGHSTVLIEWNGMRLLTDPVLRPRIGHLRRHAAIPELQAPDAVLISHAHRDHADLATLRRLCRGATAFGPPTALAVATAAGIDALAPMRAGDVRTLPGGPPVEATHAVHDGRRAPYGPDADAIGFLVGAAGEAGGIWYPGDTEPHESFRHLARRELDVALMPVWGWGPSLGPGHLDPRQAAELTAEVAPRRVIPIHWGTYLPAGLKRRHGELLRTPPQEFAQHLAALAPGVEVHQLAVGESLDLE